MPYPFRIADDAFEEVASHSKDAWGWFGVRSTWLPENRDRPKRRAFVEYVLQLVEEARSKGKRVDAVVLPELALNFTQFVELARALAKDGMIEF